jgi:hypothetical protein
MKIKKVQGVNVAGYSFGGGGFCSADKIDVQSFFDSDVSGHRKVALVYKITGQK